jgi:hypothetical protein
MPFKPLKDDGVELFCSDSCRDESLAKLMDRVVSLEYAVRRLNGEEE